MTPIDRAEVRGESYLLQAIELARESRAVGNPPFGSVLVDSVGAVIGSERNTVASDRDITAHPELKLAKWAAQSFDLGVCRTLTMYTSCQPCPMCANVIARAGIGRVVYALSANQLQALKPDGYVNPDAAAVEYDGPALHAAAVAPLTGYYS